MFGRKLIEKNIISAGYDVVALDNFTNSVHGLKNESVALQRVEEITGKKVAFYKCDLLDVALLTDIFNNHKIVSVIHFAAMKAVGESMQFPLLYYKNNLIGMINLLEVGFRLLALNNHTKKNLVYPTVDEGPRHFQFGIQ